MPKQHIHRRSQVLAKWQVLHSNAKLALIGVALWKIPLLLVCGMALVIQVMPESTPTLISAPIAVVIYFASILMTFVLPVSFLVAWIMIPFAAWRTYRDYRNEKRRSNRSPSTKLHSGRRM